MTVAEGGIRSPLIISGPGIQGGRQIDAFSYVTDLMPTLLEMAAIAHPEKFRGRRVEQIRGRSLAPVLSEVRSSVYGIDEFVSGEMQNGKWVRRGDFKAVSVAPPYGPGTWMLYDLANDPGETRDLAKEEPETLKQLQAEWDRYANDVGVVLTAQ
jgi:arylsulfatase